MNSMGYLQSRAVDCCQGGASEREHGCICGHDERILRGFARGDALESLTPTEREWCVNEADWAGEGAYNSKDAPTGDQDLAHWVLSAWNDYAASQRP